MTGKLDIITPGEVLAEEFLAPLKISQNKLARDIDVPVSRISGIIKGERSITADTALCFASYFGTSADMWMHLQNSYDLRVARRERGAEIERAVRPGFGIGLRDVLPALWVF